MSRIPALLRGFEMQLDVVACVPAGDLGRASRCEGWTIREVLNHSLGVTRKFADFASGVTDEPHAPPGDLLGRDHVAAAAHTFMQARAAWEVVGVDRTCRLAFGDFSADTAAGINLFDLLAHAWDMAATIPVPLDEDLDLWVSALDAAREVVGPARDPNHYAAELPTSAHASAMHRFLAFVGRLPDRA